MSSNNITPPQLIKIKQEPNVASDFNHSLIAAAVPPLSSKPVYKYTMLLKNGKLEKSPTKCELKSEINSELKSEINNAMIEKAIPIKIKTEKINNDFIPTVKLKSDLTLDHDEPSQHELEFLKNNFGHSEFRKSQWRIIQSIIYKNQDNFAVMATGFGKSLCYQYPALYLNGITLVVSPLISLMEDQVHALQLKNINSCLLGSAQPNKNILTDIYDGKYRIIYACPEYMKSNGNTLVRNINDRLSLIAIDEAHCISQWGHDFRPSFRILSRLREITDAPILAVTATATDKVQHDIINNLKLKNPQIVLNGVDRPNLQFIIHYKMYSPWQSLKPLIHEYNGNGSIIIYCLKRAETEEIAHELNLNGVSCVPYHGGMTLPKRTLVHNNFVNNICNIVVATVAFGMGINKPDVRLIIHYGMPKNLENYYQEVGRAGRDNLPSKCVLFYSHKDVDFHNYFLNNPRYKVSIEIKMMELMKRKLLMDFLQTSGCRRLLILRYFDGDKAVCSPRIDCCDNCKRKCSNNLQNQNIPNNILVDRSRTHAYEVGFVEDDEITESDYEDDYEENEDTNDDNEDNEDTEDDHDDGDDENNGDGDDHEAVIETVYSMIHLLKTYPLIMEKCTPLDLQIFNMFFKESRSDCDSLLTILDTLNISESILFSSIDRLIQSGYAIKRSHLELFNITNDLFNKIYKILPLDESIFTIGLRDVKKQLLNNAVNLTYDQIRLVLSYCRVRAHLKKFKYTYSDPDDSFSELNVVPNTIICSEDEYDDDCIEVIPESNGNEININNEINMDNEVNVDNEINIGNEINIENEVNIENEINIGNEINIENELNMDDIIFIDNDMLIDDTINIYNETNRNIEINIDNNANNTNANISSTDVEETDLFDSEDDEILTYVDESNYVASSIAKPNNENDRHVQNKQNMIDNTLSNELENDILFSHTNNLLMESNKKYLEIIQMKRKIINIPTCDSQNKYLKL